MPHARRQINIHTRHFGSYTMKRSSHATGASAWRQDETEKSCSLLRGSFYITTQPQPADGGGGAGADLAGSSGGGVSRFLIPSISLSNTTIFFCASSYSFTT